MANVEAIFANAKFVGSLGIELIGFGHGWCETQAVVRPDNGGEEVVVAKASGILAVIDLKLS